MSKIAGQSPQAAQTPWADSATREVRQLRSAITSHMSEKKVGRDLAPMMSELLARLDSFVEGEPVADLDPPPSPGAAEPPSLREAASALSTASDKIAQVAQSADPQTRASLSNMAKVLDEHLAMRHEILQRK
jgi:hypothetical protein